MKKSNNQQWIICLEQYEIGSQCLYLNCLHLFYYTCIVNWLLNHNNCPICKEDYKINKNKLKIILRKKNHIKINHNTNNNTNNNNNNIRNNNGNNDNNSHNNNNSLNNQQNNGNPQNITNPTNNPNNDDNLIINLIIQQNPTSYNRRKSRSNRNTFYRGSGRGGRNFRGRRGSNRGRIYN